MRTRQEIEAQLLQRAASDQDFRALLVEDPLKALKEESGITVTKGIKVRVHEETPSSFHLVLPPSDRLSEDDMALVSGGNIYNFLNI